MPFALHFKLNKKFFFTFFLSVFTSSSSFHLSSIHFERRHFAVKKTTKTTNSIMIILVKLSIKHFSASSLSTLNFPAIFHTHTFQNILDLFFNFFLFSSFYIYKFFLSIYSFFSSLLYVWQEKESEYLFFCCCYLFFNFCWNKFIYFFLFLLYFFALLCVVVVVVVI